MNSYRVILTRRAEADLRSIHKYISKDSAQNADAMIERIWQTLEPLKQFPNRTVVSHESARLRHPVRSLPVQNYLIFYRVIESTKMVRALTIRHGARQRPKF